MSLGKRIDRLKRQVLKDDKLTIGSVCIYGEDPDDPNNVIATSDGVDRRMTLQEFEAEIDTSRAAGNKVILITGEDELED